MRIFAKETNFKFMNKKGYAFLFSGCIIAVGIFLFFTRGFNLGVDFTGGSNIEVTYRQDTKVSDIRAALSKMGLGKSQIQRVSGQNRFFIKATAVEKTGTNSPTDTSTASEEDESAGITKIVDEALKSTEEKELSATKLDINNASEAGIASWLVSKGLNRTAAEETGAKLVALRSSNESLLINSFEEIEGLGLKEQALNALKEHTYLGNYTFLSVEMVGPQVGHKMRQKVTLATFWALLGMLIYIGFRFKFIFGISAVITLLHDVLVVLTFILLFQVEVSIYVIAGILTIVGYSLNDTIVIFDRIRDNLKLMKREEAELLLDRSLNQTLSRTIMTSGTTLLTVIALFFFGGEVLHAFSFTLLIGIFFGTYSSIYQSCAWLKVWQKAFIGAKK